MTGKTKPHAAALAALFSVVAAQTAAQAAEPLLYEGFLTAGDGTPLDGEDELTFRLYCGDGGGDPALAPPDAATAGPEVVPVTYQDGRFLAVLEGFDAADFVEGPCWLGIARGEQDDLAPRQRIGAVPWSLTGGAGEAGPRALVEQARVEAIEGCPAGGVVLRSGLDVDGDGVLTDGIDDFATSHVCDGARGEGGLAGPRGADGAEGARAPPGEAGAQGPPGEAGPRGAPGADARPASKAHPVWAWSRPAHRRARSATGGCASRAAAPACAAPEAAAWPSRSAATVRTTIATGRWTTACRDACGAMITTRHRRATAAPSGR